MLNSYKQRYFVIYKNDEFFYKESIKYVCLLISTYRAPKILRRNAGFVFKLTMFYFIGMPCSDSQHSKVLERIFNPNIGLYNASDKQAEYLNNLMFCFLENREKKNIFKMYRLSGVRKLFFLKYLL